MKIAYVSEGCTTHDRLFLEALAREGHTVLHLHLAETTFGVPLQGDIRDITPRGLPSALTPGAVFQAMPSLGKRLAEAAPDLILAGPVQTAGLCAALTSGPLKAICSWGSDILVHADESDLMRWTTDFVLRSADLFMCDCDAVREKGMPLLRPGVPVTQFPWGIDLDRFHPPQAGKAPSGEGEDAFRFIHVRNMEPTYNVENLLRGFAKARAQNPRLELSLLGGGSLRDDLLRLAADLCPDGAVKFLGRIPHQEIQARFRKANAYVSASLSDGSSVSLLEAMASGLPVVVSDIPGNREWVTHGEGGFLFDPRDTDDISRQLLTIADMSPDEKTRAAAANMRRCEAKANWEINGKTLARALESLAGKP